MISLIIEIVVLTSFTGRNNESNQKIGDYWKVFYLKD